MENCMSSDLSPHRTHSTIPFHHSIPPFQSTTDILEFTLVYTTIVYRVVHYTQYFGPEGHSKLHRI